MFMVKTISKERATGEVKAIYEQMIATFGFLPPHARLFAVLDLEGLQEFLRFHLYLSQHPKIDANMLPFLRLYIAQKESRSYCTMFNTKLLLAKGIKHEHLAHLQENFNKLAFEPNQILLAKTVLKAIYDTLLKEDLYKLYAHGFEEKEFYDLLNYTTLFMAKSKIIDIYLKKER